MPRTLDLWHEAGRAARDDRKRWVAFAGVLWTGPVLILGSFVSHVFTDGPGAALAGLRRPFAFIAAPLVGSYESDDDLALLGYVGWQLLLLCLLWGYFGGTLYRLAAVDLALGRRETSVAARAFAKRHWRATVGARLAIWFAILAPLAAGALLALGGRIGGGLGGVLLAVAIVCVAGLAFVAAFIGFVYLVAGFLTGPTVACEDSDAFDAVTRAFTYGGAGLPSLVGKRLLFGAGVLIGSGWRLLRTVVVVGLGLAVVRLGAGEEPIERALAIVGALGRPQDAERLGIGWGDYLVAFALALTLAVFVALWVADLLARVACGRVALYLLVRERVDGVPRGALRSAPAVRGFQTAEEVGFVEVTRVGED